MFEKKSKQQKQSQHKSDFFGNGDDSETAGIEGELIDIANLMDGLNKEIKTAKQNEKNASIKGVYSSDGQKQKTTHKNTTVKQYNGCGCF